MTDRAAAVLLEFSRAVASGQSDTQVLGRLVEAAVTVVGAEGAIAMRVRPEAVLEVVASQGVPEALASLRVDADTIGSELGAALLAASDGRFERAEILPIVSHGGLFGVLALLSREATPSSGDALGLADGLVDLVATAMNQSAQLRELQSAHSQLQDSQDLLVRTEKLRALGQMAAGIAHDLKNLLNPLSLNLDLIKRAATRGDAARVLELVTDAKAVIWQGAETVERLREFSRQTPERGLDLADLNKLAHEALELAKPRMASRRGALNVLREDFGELPPISARRSEVVNALLNLVVNAMDAMPDGGAITVRTSQERGGVLLQVIDSGPGMPQEVAAHAFEPFFTTKGDTGTGLGLAMVSSCMQRHRGTVSLDTELGNGTTVSLWFPVAAQSQPTDAPARD